MAQLERLVPRYRLVVEKLAEAAEDQFRRQSVIHATNLAVLIHLGKPQVGEPLSVAWERVVAGDCERLSGLHPFNWKAQPTYFICRDLLLPYLPGKNEKEKVALVMASAPAWLVWFTFYDIAAQALDLPAPDLSSMRKFYRSSRTLAQYPALPKGAFAYRPWPNGADEEPFTAGEKALLDKAILGVDEKTTPRERRRVMRLYARSPSVTRSKATSWPEFP